MRILHVTPTYLPAYRYGGPIYSVHGLCRSLAAAGHDVHVLATSVDGPHDSVVPYDRLVDIDGVQVHYCRSKVMRRLYWSRDLLTQCNRMIREFDAVHLHSVFLTPTWIGARAAGRAGIPYVLSPRGMLVGELIKRRSTAVKYAWIRLIERRNLSKAARIHLTSEQERRSLDELRLTLAPTVVIPNGVDPPTSFSPDAVSSDVRQLVAKGFDILSLGRIKWTKGLDRLIRSAAEMPRIKVLIAGPDEDGLTENLRKLAEEYGVGDRVLFLFRQIDGPDKESLFAAARVFALPSLSESFGNVIAEAMIRGLPVVVTAGVGAAQIVEESGGGVLAPTDPKGFAAVIRCLLESNERLAIVGAAGAKFAQKTLSWDNIGRRFGELYLDVRDRKLCLA